LLMRQSPRRRLPHRKHLHSSLRHLRLIQSPDTPLLFRTPQCHLRPRLRLPHRKHLHSSLQHPRLIHSPDSPLLFRTLQCHLRPRLKALQQHLSFEK
ncbi:hypothetical protein J6590_058046, partial [Homalodisca vitripennis]